MHQLVLSRMFQHDDVATHTFFVVSNCDPFLLYVRYASAGAKSNASAYGFEPSAALIKAVLINSGKSLTTIQTKPTSGLLYMTGYIIRHILDDSLKGSMCACVYVRVYATITHATITHAMKPYATLQ